MARIGFDATTVAPQAPTDSTPLPKGIYTAEITAPEVRDFKSGNGTGLSLEFTIIDPNAYANRKVWANLNIRHTSEQAQQIGQAQLSALCHAVGIKVLEDSDQLFGKILRIHTRVKPAQGEYPARAEVVGFEPAGTAAPAPTAAPQAATPPWGRRAA